MIALTSASALATLALDASAGWYVLAAWIAALVALFAILDHHWRKRFPGTP
jgi:hypothetical protein